MPDPLRLIQLRSEIPDASRPGGRSRGMADLVWYQGETVLIRCSFQALGIPRAISPGCSVRLIGWSGTDMSTLYLDRPGTVVSAAGGYVEITIAPNFSALPPAAYNCQIKVYDPEGADMGIGLSGLAQVLPSPDGTAVFSGPFRVIDWATIDEYQNASTDGPILLGPGIVYTVQPNGSLLIQLDTTAPVILDQLLLYNPDTDTNVRLTVRGEFNQLVRENLND